MIKINSLHKYFNRGKQNELHVINDITLDLPERGMVAIFGKSGCGKTTLLNVIGGLDRFGSGTLCIDGQDIKKNTDDIRNRYIGYIFQNYNLNVEESCFENVADALKLCGVRDSEEIDRRVTAALKNVGMGNYRLRTPDTLSGGQQQRIAIARAIVKNPKIILADEPTGNLDEANTVVIMDLLKEISREHLVILVTHEENLVDYYCDKVIELSDGKVVNVRENKSVAGYSTRDKNDIFLGELEKSESVSDGAAVEYYGNPLTEPVKIKIVNSGGKLYLRVDTPKVQILDSSSEVKLKEGVYKKPERAEKREGIDMTDLPPVECKKTGRLFTFLPAVKSGYLSNFKKGKKGKRFFRVCLGMFAAVLVFVSASFGTALKQLTEINGAYNHNVFYVATSQSEQSDKLLYAASANTAGIDYVRLNPESQRTQDLSIVMNTGFFETFSTSQTNSSLSCNAVLLSSDLCADLKVVAGRKDNIGSNEIVITTAVADEILKNSSLGFITKYRDLLGLTTTNVSGDGSGSMIVGVVQSTETAAYLSEMTLARYFFRNSSSLSVALASDFDLASSDGKVTMIVNYKESGKNFPALGDSVKLNGKQFTIGGVYVYSGDYSEWLADNKLPDVDMYDFILGKMREEIPDLPENNPESYDNFVDLYEQAEGKYCYEYYCTRLAYFDDYIKVAYAVNNDIDKWIYLKKGSTAAKAVLVSDELLGETDYAELAWVFDYVKANGTYPTVDDWEREYSSNPQKYDSFMEDYKTMRSSYQDEMNADKYGKAPMNFYTSAGYLLSDNDFIEISKRTGETHSSATSTYESAYPVYANVYEDIEKIAYDNGLTESKFSDVSLDYYTVVHTTNVKETKAYLVEEFGEKNIITPDNIRDEMLGTQWSDIASGLISFAVILAIMCVCMYFMMRSSLMSRIKEIGIYRAIGVSKKNVIFKFFVEAAVLTVLTVFIGYLISSLVVGSLGSAAIISSILYYPVYLAVVVGIILCAICIFFGILPILTLLRKTPSEILSKYDI
jgi:ABC-type lipoprotein export system ATPase subunit/ABC-type antimicrobial peptide transport system permease subunit